MQKITWGWSSFEQKRLSWDVISSRSMWANTTTNSEVDKARIVVVQRRRTRRMPDRMPQVYKEFCLAIMRRESGH